MRKNYSMMLLSGISLACILTITSCRKDVKNSLIPVASTTDAAPVFVGDAPGTNFVANEILLKFKKGVNPEIMNQVYARVGATLKERILTAAMQEAGDMDGVFLISIPGEVKSTIEVFKTMPEVEYAEPNFIYTHFATSNDTYFTGGSLWGMYSSTSSTANSYGCAAVDAWAAGHTGSSDVYVGIIDEGFMYGHEDLSSNSWQNPYETAGNRKDDDKNGYIDDIRGWDFDGRNNSTFDGTSDDHGTHVAGTIGAVGGNGKGVAGVNWSIKMISCKFLGNSGGTTANAIKAVDYITDLKTRHSMNIVATNNSWGGGGYSQSLKDAIDRAGAKEILFIAAAGNSTLNIDATASYPASYTSSNIIAVAALTSTGALASYSNYGASSVDIGAPGSSIYSTLPASSTASTYGAYSGTSMATPHVTGAAALYASTHSGSSAATIKAAILNAAVANSALTGKCTTGGQLNVSGF